MSYKNRRLLSVTLESQAYLKKSFNFSYKIRPLLNKNTGIKFGRL